MNRWKLFAGVAIFACIGAPAFAGTKAIGHHKTIVEGQAFKVIRYDDGSVKVVDGGMFGPGYSYKQRERMRQAAKQATGCEVIDDFDQDGKLLGTLLCATQEGAL